MSGGNLYAAEDILIVTRIDRLAPASADFCRIVSALAEKGAAFKVVDDPLVDTTAPTEKLVTGIFALIAEFENDIRRSLRVRGI